MPQITSQGIQKVQSHIASLQNKIARAKANAELKAGEVKDGLEIVGAPMVLGFLRGRMEKGSASSPGKPFVIPGTAIDIELATGMTLVGLGLMDALGEYDQDALMAGYGCLAHYAGQLSRNYGKTGEFSLVAGDGMSVGALPGSMSII